MSQLTRLTEVTQAALETAFNTAQELSNRIAETVRSIPGGAGATITEAAAAVNTMAAGLVTQALTVRTLLEQDAPTDAPVYSAVQDAPDATPEPGVGYEEVEEDPERELAITLFRAGLALLD